MCDPGFLTRHLVDIALTHRAAVCYTVAIQLPVYPHFMYIL
jgi:hypothetical protein